MKKPMATPVGVECAMSGDVIWHRKESAVAALRKRVKRAIAIKRGCSLMSWRTAWRRAGFEVI